MNGDAIMKVLILVETALVCVLFLVIPSITRRGLLFGVYVGEEVATGEGARSLRDAWTRAGTAVTALALGVSAAALWWSPLPWSVLVASLLPVAVLFALYLVFYRRARLLRGPYVEPALAAAPLGPATARGSHAALLVLVACVALAVVPLAFAVNAWPRLPARIPTHFGASGLPDGWAAKSVASVFLLPGLALVMAFVLGGTTWLVSFAKRTVRADDGGRSLAAQERFRSAMTWYMAGIALITQTMIVVLGVRSLQVGLGERDGLGGIVWLFLVGLLVWVFGGLVWLMTRVGQGGARLEGDTMAPLTDGLADDRHWMAGLIYVNREDPSILVENRFGLGYTVNLGNPWAVVFLVLVLAAPLAVLVVAFVAR